jgi:hypothetical protein
VLNQQVFGGIENAGAGIGFHGQQAFDERRFETVV